MKRITFIVIVIINLLFLSSCETVRDLLEILGIYAERSLRVKIISFNILNSGRDGKVDDVEDWNDRSDFVTNIIKNKSDIAGLQEVLNDQKVAIEFLLPPNWGHIGVGRDDGEDEGEYCSIFYSKERFTVDENGTFWFSDNPDEAGSKSDASWGNPSHKRICTWGRFIEKSSERGFYVYNLHLSPNSGADDPILNRMKSIVLLQERIKDRSHPEDPFIVTGDFNAEPTEISSIGLMGGPVDVPPWVPTPTIPWLPEPLIKSKDSWAVSQCDELEEDCEELQEMTFHDGEGGEGIGSRIDYIFVRDDVLVIGTNILRFTVGGYYPSDHYPIFASLSLIYSD